MRRQPQLIGSALVLVAVLGVPCLGVPFCEPPLHSDHLGFGRTICDSEFCVCNDPYGRIHCRCPTEVQVDEIVLRSSGECAVPQETTALDIDNCQNVTVTEEAFSNAKELRSIVLANIKVLSLESGAFRYRGHNQLSLNFTNVTVIPDVPSFAFAGNIESITFDHCYMGMIRAFAFSNIESAQRISIADSNVANVESQAFKKFLVSKFIISGSKFNLIPSRFLFDVDVENLFKIESSFIDSVRTSAFKLNNPKVTMIAGSRINSVGSEAFRIRTNGDVVVQNNKFHAIEREAFRGLYVERYVIQHAGKPKFRFVNNTLSEYDGKSLYYNRTSFEAQFARVMIDEPCTCDGLISWRDMIHERHTTSEKSIEDDVEPFWCRDEDDGRDTTASGSEDFVSGKEFYQANCTTLTKSIFFFVIIISATAVSLFLIILFIICFFRRRRRWDLVPTAARDGVEPPGKPPKKVKGDHSGDVEKGRSPKAIIVPDGRTYRETEFHVIVEKAEPLEVGYIPCKVVRDRSRSQISTK